MTTAQDLADQLLRGDTAERSAAASQLATMGPDAAPAAAALVDACGDDALRDMCVGALEELGPPAPDQLPRLGELATSLDPDTAYWAATLLGRAGDEAGAFASGLAKVVADGAAPWSARERAAWALGKIGPAASEALPALRAVAASSPPPRLARMVAEAIQSVGG